MKHVIPHTVGLDSAQKVAEQALASYAERFAKYNPSVKWIAPHRAEIAFKVKGIALSGAVEVLEKAIELELEVPFLLRPFKSQALKVIEDEINQWLAKAKPA
jgi:Putative polyhydroxyalkanoic acid system protein (PHA_gran_rgn)